MSKSRPPRSNHFLPKRVEPWMIYTDTDEMRVQMFKHGYADAVGIFGISWDEDRAEYVVHLTGKGVFYYFAREADAYRFARRATPKIQNRHLSAVSS